MPGAMAVAAASIEPTAEAEVPTLAASIAETVIEHTWHEPGRLGIKIMPRDGTPETPDSQNLPCGVIISEVPKAEDCDTPFPQEVKAGMLLEAINGQSILANSFHEIMTLLRMT